MEKCYSTLLTIICLTQLYGQSAKEQLGIANSVRLESQGFYTEIHCRDKFGYLIVPVKIGSESYDYIFDTGGYNTLTSDIMVRNGLAALMTVEAGSANQIKSRIALTKIPSVQIGGISFTGVGAFNFDFLEAPQILCYTNGGLVGKSIIHSAVWQIDSQNKTIVLTDDKDKLDHLEGAIQLKVKLDKVLNPFVTAKINGRKVSFLLDFGYSGLISLTGTEGRKVESNPTVEINGEGAVGANGAIRESMFAKWVDQFEIGDHALGDRSPTLLIPTTTISWGRPSQRILL